MHNNLLIILGLLFVVMMLVLVAQRIKVAYPIFLVVAGLGISFIPGIPRIGLDPDLIFLIFLPPLLYEAAWYTSWKDFWKWKRPIMLLAFGLVFFTSLVVACTATAIIPGFTLALGFLLGGIVSPPDAVAAATVLKGVKVPRRALTILEGESLVNDASSLIVFRFALAAVLTGTFSLDVAVGQFFMSAGMGMVVGLAIAHIMYAIHRFLPTTPAMDATLTVMSPYIIFLTAEHFHFSGVIGVVSGGLFLSYRSHEIFRTGDTRLNMIGVWRTMIFIMNALVFVLIGLELPEIIAGLGSYSIADAIRYGLIISSLIVALRFIWLYPATFVPRMLFRSIRENEPNPGWRGPLLIGWAGMRGVVSLATALSIPVMMTDTEQFPLRNLIVFITFIVIFITLVVQGLTLPLLIKLVKFREIDPEMHPHEEQAGIKLRINQAALAHLEAHYTHQTRGNQMINYFKQDLKNDIGITRQKLDSMECSDIQKAELEHYTNFLHEIYQIQRHELHKLRREKFYSDEQIRHMELQLDLEEMKITHFEH
jgi:monovalent cation/hydrogen antiporter